MNYNRFISKCIIALLFCIIGLTSCGDKIPTNEIHYTTIDNSVLPIKDLFYFGAGRIVSNSYDPDKNVCILKLDKDVTEIGKEPFKDCESLTSITIPESVTEIGDSAFCGCSNLTFITLPESLTEIGEKVFYNCRLKSISIPPSVT
ncbi:MAG: leucine-rich repeat domain-containing protein, partial [Bacteroidaceae bacterium]|nr:leucine-rich repeat domain-containing protein [Bacteroidaceae bacterium]